MLSIRKIGVISRTYRHLNRYRHILAVLLKHGFGELVDALRIDQYLEVGLQMIPAEARRRAKSRSRDRSACAWPSRSWAPPTPSSARSCRPGRT